MNYRYGHLENGLLVYAKTTVTFDGKVYINPPADVYLQLNPPEKLIVDQQPTEPAPEGKHYEVTGWSETETEVRRVYTLVDDPPVPEPPPPGPRKFSKMYLELALFNMGMLNDLDEFIDNQSITNEFGQTMPLRRLYDKALVFAEDNQHFSQYLGLVKAALGLSDQEIETILSQCVAEE